ncbi:beta-lactamase family protein [Mycolicibacterium madagascariense]|nr:beta-lactamase family protein [Mycolicibacterium madagascariense]
MATATALLAAGVGAVPARASTDLAAVLTDVTADQRLAGGVAVTRDGTTVSRFSAGYSDVDTHAGFGPHIRIRAASVTKTFVAATMLQLVAEGKVDLDASVESYLPGRIRGAGIDATAITVRELLHNSSGLPEYYYDTDPHGPPQTSQQLLDLALRKPAQFSPGAMIKYTNTNFVVAGMIITAVTGRDPADEITRRIIVPLGLADTYFPAAGDTTLRAPFAHGYELLGGPYLPASGDLDPASAAPHDGAEPGPRVDVTPYEPSNSDMAGALVSSGEDLTTFMAALVGGRVIPRPQLAQMMATAPWPEGGRGRGYGLGLISIALPCGVTVWGHGGDLFGYHTLSVASDQRRALSVTFNQAGAPGSIDPRDRVLEATYCTPGA